MVPGTRNRSSGPETEPRLRGWAKANRRGLPPRRGTATKPTGFGSAGREHSERDRPPDAYPPSSEGGRPPDTPGRHRSSGRSSPAVTGAPSKPTSSEAGSGGTAGQTALRRRAASGSERPPPLRRAADRETASRAQPATPSGAGSNKPELLRRALQAASQQPDGAPPRWNTRKQPGSSHGSHASSHDGTPPRREPRRLPGGSHGRQPAAGRRPTSVGHLKAAGQRPRAATPQPEPTLGSGHGGGDNVQRREWKPRQQLFFGRGTAPAETSDAEQTVRHGTAPPLGAATRRGEAPTPSGSPRRAADAAAVAHATTPALGPAHRASEAIAKATDQRLRAAAPSWKRASPQAHAHPPRGADTANVGKESRSRNSTGACSWRGCERETRPRPCYQAGAHPAASAGGSRVQRLRPARTTGHGASLRRGKTQGSIERRPVETPERLQRTPWWSNALRSSDRRKRSWKRSWQHGHGRHRRAREQRREGTNRGDAGRLPGREKLRRVSATGKGAASRQRGGKPETWRTPWPVAGCNRPARPGAE